MKAIVLHSTLAAKVERLKRATYKLREQRLEVERIAHEVLDELKRGTTLDEPLLEYVLLASKGFFDPQFIQRHQALLQHCKTHPGRQILLVQKATYTVGTSIQVLRTVHLAVLREGTLGFDLENGLLSIPVEAGHYVWAEYRTVRGVNYKAATNEDRSLVTGPLHSVYTRSPVASVNARGVAYVPRGASFEYTIAPWNRDGLYRAHGITSAMTTLWTREWMRLRTRAYAS